MKRLRLCTLLLLLDSTRLSFAEPTPTAAASFAVYSRSVETRLAQQHHSAAFIPLERPLAPDELRVERLSPATGADLPGALLHHWRGTAFALGAHAADFVRLMRDFNSYPQHFAPQVTEARLVSHATPDSFQATMRVRQYSPGRSAMGR